MIYLIRVAVEPAHAAAWLRWQRETHIPDLLEQPGFLGARVFAVEVAGGDWPQYVVQYSVQDRAALEAYLQSDASVRLRGDHTSRFGPVTKVSREYWDEILG